MKKRIWFTGLLMTALMATAVAIAAAFEEPRAAIQPTPPTMPDYIQNANANGRQKMAPRDLPQPNSYIVYLIDQPLASYKGTLEGFAATSPVVTKERRLDMRSEASVAYRAYLTAKQNDLLAEMGKSYGRSVDALYHYNVALNGVAVVMSEEEAAAALTMSGVTAVVRDEWNFPSTDATPAFIGATALWDGTATGGLPGTKGEGIIVGVIDSGIWPEHPSFADDGSYPPPPADWGGYCQPPGDGQNPYSCNNKLIGAQHFLEGYIAAFGGTYNGDFYSARDDNGHGTHTASTAAGNENIDAIMLGVPRGTISGIAPRAYVSAYKALGPWGGISSDLAAAIDAAVADGVDVINYSIGGASTDPWQDPDALAFLNARDAGVFAAVSAGNAGPTPSTLGSPGDAPWVMTIAASNSNRHFLSDIVVTPTLDIPLQLYGASLTAGVNNMEFVDAENYTDSWGENGRLCLHPFADNTFTANQVVLCERGENARIEKGENVLAGGAGGVVLANADPGDISADSFPLPGVHVDAPIGDALRDHIAANSPVAISFTDSQAVLAPDPRVTADQMAEFSSRGPVLHGNSNYLKPSITGPGVQILAGQTPFADGAPTGELFQTISGTSMSSPHIAGAAALLAALHPDWTPAEIESALMTTANDTHLKEDGATPADAFDMGAGRVDLLVASKAGLVLNVTTEEYLAANPDSGGDPADLNIASLAESQCLAECSWQRTVRSTLGYSVTWTAVVSDLTDINVAVSPAQFELGPGMTQTIAITVNVETFDADGAWHFPRFALQPDAVDVPEAHFPIALLPTNSIFQNPVKEESDAKAGTVTVDVISRAISDLTLTPIGLTMGTVVTNTLHEDPTPDDPYDNLNDGSTAFITVTVPANTARLVAETLDSTAVDLDLYIGEGNTPSAVTQRCSSATPYPQEYCNISTPYAGEWWILVQNWREGSAPPDLTTMVYAIVAEDTGDLTASGPTAVPSGDPFEVALDWEKSDLQPNDRAYGAVLMGADAAHPDNIGYINLDILYRGAAIAEIDDAVTILQPSNVVQSYTLTLNNTGDIEMEWSVSKETAAARIALTMDDQPVAAPPLFSAAANAPYFWKTVEQTAVSEPIARPPLAGQSIDLVIDDGTIENALGAGRQFIWLNRFTPNAGEYPFALTEVQILFPANSNVYAGETVDIYVYQDIDGNPNTGATHVGSVKNQEIQAVDGSTFSVYSLEKPIRIDGPSGDVLIAVVNRTAGLNGGYPASLDTGFSQSRSWVGLYSAGAPADPPTLPADTNWGIIDSFGIPGNWMIRGYGEKCGADSIDWLSVSPESGVTAPGASSDLQLTVDTTGLENGEHTAVLCFDSNASNVDDVFIRVPVTVVVGGGIYLPLIVK